MKEPASTRSSATTTAKHEPARAVGGPHPLVDLWIAVLASENKSAHTRRAYTIDLAQFQEYLRGIDLLAVTAEDVAGFALFMTRQPSPGQRAGGRESSEGLQPRTRARRLIAVRQFYEWLVETGRLATNPARGTRPPKVPRRLPNHLDEREILALRAVIPATPRGVRDRAMVELGLASLRVSEVTGLTLEGVRELGSGAVTVVVKGGAEKAKALTDEALTALRAWLAIRPPCPGDSVFVSLPPRRPYRLHHTTLERILHAYTIAAKIVTPHGARKIRFHDLRHTTGHHLAVRGVPLHIIQDILGHADPKTTRIYTGSTTTEEARQVLRREFKF